MLITSFEEMRGALYNGVPESEREKRLLGRALVEFYDSLKAADRALMRDYLNRHWPRWRYLKRDRAFAWCLDDLVGCTIKSIRRREMDGDYKIHQVYPSVSYVIDTDKARWVLFMSVKNPADIWTTRFIGGRDILLGEKIVYTSQYVVHNYPRYISTHQTIMSSHVTSQVLWTGMNVPTMNLSEKYT